MHQENKIYEIQGQKFCLKPDVLSVKKHGVKLIGQLKKLQFEYLSGIDFSLLNRYKARFDELETALSQLKEIIKNNVDSEGNELHEGKKSEFENQIDDLEIKFNETKVTYENDTEAQSLIKLRNEMEELAFADLLYDYEFLKPIFQQILTGGNLKVIKWDACSFGEANEFITEVVSDFFGLLKAKTMT